MKRCQMCGLHKPLTEFHRRSVAKDGLQSRCKPCACATAKRSQDARLPQVLQRIGVWCEANRERSNSYKQAWRERNRERNRAINAAWKAANPGKSLASSARRRDQVIRATPVWANTFFIEEIYHLAKLRTEILGVPHHVDHIVPLLGKTVCGLHVEHNLQVIPAIENLRKGAALFEGVI